MAASENQTPAGGPGSGSAALAEAGKPKNTAPRRTPIDGLSLVLSRMPDVRKECTGWRSRCPACGGNAHKVAITEGSDGRALLWCFGCSDTRAILHAIGLDWQDIFPPRSWPESPKGRQAAVRALRGELAWRAALPVLGHEATIVQVAAGDLLKGQQLEAADHARLHLACDRISKAREVLR